jgi:uncharacterized protein
MTPAPTIARLWRYPVKSMLGQRCSALALDARGIVGDRVFALRDHEGKLASGKTSRRLRAVPGMLGYSATDEVEESGRDGGPVIRFPDGQELAADDPGVDSALSAALGQPLTLAKEDQTSHFDAAPVHLLTTASLAWLRGFLPGVGLDERRFRPNLLIDLPGAEPAEQSWIGKDLSIGPVQLSVTAACPRCAMVTHAQSDLEQDPAILKAIAREAGGLLGVYARVLTPGTIRVGDTVRFQS